MSLPLGQLGFAHRGQELVAWDREFRVLSEDAFGRAFHGGNVAMGRPARANVICSPFSTLVRSSESLALASATLIWMLILFRVPAGG